VLVTDNKLGDFFEQAVKLVGAGLAQVVGNWIVNDLLAELARHQSLFRLNREKTRIVPLTQFEANLRDPNEPTLAYLKITPKHIAELGKLIAAGTLLHSAAKEVFAVMAATGAMPGTIIADKGLAATPTDAGELEQWCRDAITANPKALAEFQAGKESAINAFKGPVMKAAKGKANPKLVDETLRRLLAAG